MATIQFKKMDEYLFKISKLEAELKDQVLGEAIYGAAGIVADEIRQSLEQVPTDESFGTSSAPTSGPRKKQVEDLMDSLGIAYIPCHQAGTVIHLAIDGKYAGHLLISDKEKPHSKEAVSELKKSGVSMTVMLTGDRKEVADLVAADLGIDRVYSQLLPAGKVEKVEELLRNKSKKEKLAFVGDGINDAPVLSRADIGIAMGAMGSDAAIEAADVVLMDDDPLKISKAIKISRKCLRIVYQNIVFAIGVKFICLLLGALGIANMWLAIFADVGVMILAVINAIRALFVKKL